MGSAGSRSDGGQVHLENRTPQTIELVVHGRPHPPLVLAPLEVRRVDRRVLDDPLARSLAEDPRLEVHVVDPGEGRLLQRLAGCAAALVALLLAASALLPGTAGVWWPWAVMVGLAGVLVVSVVRVVGDLRAGRARRHPLGDQLRTASEDLRRHLASRRVSLQWAAAVALVLVVGAGVPAAFVWFGSDLPVLAAPAADGVAATSRGLALLTAASLWLAIATFALAPALLYLLFERLRLEPLRSVFLSAAFRLFPDELRTVGDVEARYSTQLAEAYGDARVPGGRRTIARRSPLVVLTALLAVGWSLSLLPAAGAVVVPVDGAGSLGLLRPAASPAAFAFIGAYLCGLAMVARGYVRGDLSPQTCTRIALRVLAVVVLAMVLELLPQPDHPAVLVVAFALGAFPVWAQRALFDRVREVVRPGARRLALHEGAPLTAVEEIDAYDRTLLAREGIGNVEALAHADPLELLLQTRLPPARLVDWIDQALLHLYAGDLLSGSRRSSDLHARLRSCGIRTASDYRRVYHQHLDERAVEPGAPAAAAAAGLRHVLACGQPSSHQCHSGVLARLDVLLTALDGERWMRPIDRWRDPQRGARPVVQISVATAQALAGPPVEVREHADPPRNGDAPDGLAVLAREGQPTSRTMPNLSS